MLFQTLDDKKECLGVYINGEINYDGVPDNLTATWSFADYLAGRDVQYANLYCAPNDIDTACPDSLKDQWEDVSEKMRAFLRSFVEAKVDLNENCFFELVPERFLLEYCELKNKITKHVLEVHEKPQNYDFLLGLVQLSEKIKYQKLNLDLSGLNGGLSSFKTRQWKKKLASIKPYVVYNIFGTKTGRLTTKKDSFPILTLPKEHRKAIKPSNDWLVELDFNAAELRTLLALSGKEQPTEDIHEWNAKNVYKGSVTRTEAKQRIFAWLYNPESKDYLSNRAYDRNIVLQKYWDGEQVQTRYNRIIPADKHHALNYIIQSTTSDLFLRRAVAVNKLLKDKKSKIIFCIHDSLVIDFSNEDREFLLDVIKEFSETELGVFKANIQAGKNFGEMKEMTL